MPEKNHPVYPNSSALENFTIQPTVCMAQHPVVFDVCK